MLDIHQGAYAVRVSEAANNAKQKPASQYYLRQGAGEPLVLVHGYLGGAPMWEPQIAALSKRFDVIAPELRGYGSNTALDSATSVDGFANEILQLLSEIGIEQFHLLGHSMGGMIVQQMTACSPDRIKSLICFGTGPRGVMPNRFETIDESRKRFLSQGVATTAKQIASKWFVEGEQADGYELCCGLGEGVSVSTALTGLRAMETWDGREALASIKQPTLVLWGDSDRSYGWEQPAALWNGIKNSNLAVIPNAGHNAHMEKPEIFNAIVENFLPKPVGP